MHETCHQTRDSSNQLVAQGKKYEEVFFFRYLRGTVIGPLFYFNALFLVSLHKFGEIFFYFPSIIASHKFPIPKTAVPLQFD